MNRLLFLILINCFLFNSAFARRSVTVDLSLHGLSCDSSVNNTPLLQRAIDKLSKQHPKDKLVLTLPTGEYHFYPDKANERIYYISNHDQNNPKNVGIIFEHLNHVTLDGNGSSFIFHGRMLPIAIVNSENCTLRNISIDFKNPHIAQVTIVKNEGDQGITFQPAPWVKARIGKNGCFETYGLGWHHQQSSGIAFDAQSRHILANTADLFYNTNDVRQNQDGSFTAPHWKDKRMTPGTVIAMRTWHRPTPGIFLSENKNTTLSHVTVHYAEGMGLLAQLCENIDLITFRVALKGENDPRYFTTQADATHFSGCKGKINSVGGLYEGMMDDAINVHGTYLKITKRLNDHQVEAQYMHPQAWGFKWGDKGDKVQFIAPETMEIVKGQNHIESITPKDTKEIKGAKIFLITFTKALPDVIDEEKGFGIENLEWTPSVYFANNTIRNNRARGTLFSTPKKTIVENNLFDHTSGTAILLCGDCNGWYETGACRKVIIRKNHFINALTSMFQFTNGVISIYPEIPNLKDQQLYFHGGKRNAIRIVDNHFETFDRPILYAKSVDGLLFAKNKITSNNDFRAFHWNRYRFFFERVKNFKIRNNQSVDGYIPIRDLMVR